MIKQIMDFSRDEAEGGAATIELFLLAEDPQTHSKILQELARDGAILQIVDCDTIRAKYKGVTQDKLLSLIDEGWSFSGQDDPDALQCQDQADKGLCGDCLEPCDFREEE